MAITLPPPYNNAPIRPADVTQTMIDLYNVVAQINAGLSPVPINLSGPGGAALIGTTPAGGITSTTVQASLNELDTKKVPFTTLASAGGGGLVGNTPAGGISSTTVQAAINELDTEKTSVAALAAPGGAALVGNTPAGGISSTTVQAALNELDTKKATIAAVQASTYVEAVGTGTADAIVGAFTPTVTSLTDGLELVVKTPGANTVTAPTFKADGTTAKTIVKDGGVALQASDAQGWLTLRYDITQDRWVLLNPSTPAGTSLIATSINSGQISGFRNRIINGDMRIDQRNNGTAVTPVSTTTYITDRFVAVATQASKLTFQQVADSPPGFKFSLKCTVASQFSPGAADVFAIRQGIEGQNIVDFQLGTATAQTITATVWVKGSVAGTYSCAFANSASTRSYIGTITIAAGWVKQTVTLVLDTTGTWLTDNGNGMTFGIDLGSGTTSNTTAGTWQAGSFTRTAGSVTFVNQVNGSTINMTGIQIEIGTSSTPFEQRSIGIELKLCQRYFQTWTTATFLPIASGFAFSTSQAAFSLQSEPMRATPTISSTNPSVFNAAGAQQTLTSLVVTNYNNGATYFTATTTGTPLTAAQGTLLNAGVSVGGTISLSAEL